MRYYFCILRYRINIKHDDYQNIAASNTANKIWYSRRIKIPNTARLVTRNVKCTHSLSIYLAISLLATMQNEFIYLYIFM